MKKLLSRLWGGVMMSVMTLGLPFGDLAGGGGGAVAQEISSLPLSLRATPVNPDRTDIGAAPALLLSHRSRIGFIKENGDYRLRADWVQKRNVWSLLYDYRGYKLLHAQSTGFAYTRNFMSGLNGEVRFAYGFSNRVEEKKAASCLAPGISISLQREKWGMHFAYDQRISLGSREGGAAKEWNELLAFRLGVNCRLYPGLYWGADLEKDIRHPLLASTTLSYLLRSSFLFWLQAQVNPTAFQMGFGYHHPRLSVQIACRYHPPLGAESEIGVALKFGRRQNIGRTAGEATGSKTTGRQKAYKPRRVRR